MLHRGLNHFVGIFLFRNIAVVSDCLTAHGFDLFNDLVCHAIATARSVPCASEIVNDDGGALLR